MFLELYNLTQSNIECEFSMLNTELYNLKQSVTLPTGFATVSRFHFG